MSKTYPSLTFLTKSSTSGTTRCGYTPARNPQNFDIYDTTEIEALCRYQEVLEAVRVALPDDHPTLSDVQAMPEWQLLGVAAEQALRVLMRRGKFPEDREIE